MTVHPNRATYDIAYYESKGSEHDMLIAVVPSGDDIQAAIRAECENAQIGANFSENELTIRTGLVECDRFDDEDDGIAELVWRGDQSYGVPLSSRNLRELHT